MAAGTTTKFEELTKLATDFVTTRKGLWDHAAWMGFMSDLQAKGFDLSEEVQANLGTMLEAMKQFYTAAASTEHVEKAVKAVVSDSVTFVKQHKGIWDHSEWEDFVQTVERNTFSLSEGATAYLGGILEAVKTLYALSPVAVAQKRLSAARGETAPAASQPAAATKEKAETKPAGDKVSKEVKETKVAKEVKEAKGTKKVKDTKVAAGLSPAAPKKQDDLTAITGIGPTLAKKLNETGISSYAQIAALSDGDIDRLEKDIIRFPGRIRRDGWVGQARALSQSR